VLPWSASVFIMFCAVIWVNSQSLWMPRSLSIRWIHCRSADVSQVGPSDLNNILMMHTWRLLWSVTMKCGRFQQLHSSVSQKSWNWQCRLAESYSRINYYRRSEMWEVREGEYGRYCCGCGDYFVDVLQVLLWVYDVKVIPSALNTSVYTFMFISWYFHFAFFPAMDKS